MNHHFNTAEQFLKALADGDNTARACLSNVCADSVALEELLIKASIKKPKQSRSDALKALMVRIMTNLPCDELTPTKVFKSLWKYDNEAQDIAILIDIQSNRSIWWEANGKDQMTTWPDFLRRYNRIMKQIKSAPND